MRKLTYYVGSSVDGFIAGPDGSVECFTVPDDVIEHIVADFPETLPTHIRVALGVKRENRRFDTVIMGAPPTTPPRRRGSPARTPT